MSTVPRMGHASEQTGSAAVMTWGLSGHHDAATACGHVLEQVQEGLDGRTPTFAFLFASKHHGTSLESIAGRCSTQLATENVVGTTVSGVIGGRSTIEDRPGIAMLVGSFPWVQAKAVVSPAHAEPIEEDADLDDWATSLIRPTDAHRGTVLFADPSSIALSRLLPAIHAAGKGQPLVGAITSSSKSRKKQDECEALLFARGRVQRGGLVGLTLAGAVHIESIVAQGCRPVGPPMVVTGSHRNLIQELGGRPALEAIKAVAQQFDDDERERLLPRGLFLGLAIDEYRERFGRGDFIVRRVLGGHGASGSIAIDEPVRRGRTVQVHLLDPTLARGDLELLLDAQKLHAPPVGALLLSDRLRGDSMFDGEWSDATALARAFDVAPPGAESAKGGYEIAGLQSPIPVSGCLTSGQIAPIGTTCRVHSSCACTCLFRAQMQEIGKPSQQG